MTIREILSELEHIGDDVPYDALDAAVAQREAIVPELIAAIERACANPTRVCEDESYVLHVHALYLLAQFRETRALPAVLRFFSLPGELPFDLAGEVPIAKHGAQILASLCGGDIAPLVALAKNESANSFVRGEAMQALALLSIWGEKSRSEILAALRELFRTLERPGSSLVWAQLVETVCCFNARELARQVREAFDAKLVDETFVAREWVEENFEGAGAEDYRQFAGEHPRITDAAAMIEEWECFQSGGNDEAAEEIGGIELEYDFHPDEPSPEEDNPSAKPLFAPPKTGRNDLCPCGSGKKFKNCCARKRN